MIVDTPVAVLVIVVTSGFAAAAVALVLISRAFWKSLQVFLNFYILGRIGIGLKHFLACLNGAYFLSISLSFSSSWIKLFKPESESSSSDSLLVPKILGYLPVYCHHRHEDWPCHHIYILNHHLTLWNSFLLSALALEELISILLLFLSLSYLFFKLTFWFRWRFRSSSLFIRLSTLPKSIPFSLGSRGTFSTILLVKSTNLDISVSEKSWKLLFRHVCKSRYCCCFWLEHAFSLVKFVEGSGCNTNLPECLSFSASTMFKRNKN